MTYAWLDVTRNTGIARIMHMLCRSKTYTWKDVILVKRSMIRGFSPSTYITMHLDNYQSFFHQPMHNWIVLKTVLRLLFNVNFNANLKLFLRLSSCASVSEKTLIMDRSSTVIVCGYMNCIMVVSVSTCL